MSQTPVKVTVWGEYLHEHTDERVRELYPEGMHECIAGAIRSQLGERVAVRTATLQQPSHGLTDDVLQSTDVLTWWGHMGHDQVADAIVAKVQQRVLDGMGLLVLHSGHYSKIFRALMGTSCLLHWREADDREIVWTVSPQHPIAEGIPEAFVVPQQEMYGEHFDIPQPDELVFISSFTGGEVFRSGCCFNRGNGRIFYFGPGHETFPVYHHPLVQRVIANAVLWAKAPQPPRVQRPEDAVPTGWFEYLT
jgi:trehalose utilization protein